VIGFVKYVTYCRRRNQKHFDVLFFMPHSVYCMSISEACLLVANVHMVNEHIFANSPDRTLNRCNIWCSSVAILFK